MSGVKCLITTGPHSISVMLLFITKNHVYWRHICYLHDGCLCSIKSYVAKVGNKEVWYGYRPPVSPASLSFPPYQSISVALHKTYLTKHISTGANIFSICLSRRGGFFIRTDRWALIYVTPPRTLIPWGAGAAANEATILSRVYEALGMLIRCIRGASRRISQPGWRTTWANSFWVWVWHHGWWDHLSYHLWVYYESLKVP